MINLAGALNQVHFSDVFVIRQVKLADAVKMSGECNLYRSNVQAHFSVRFVVGKRSSNRHVILAWVFPKLLLCSSMFEFWKLECLEHPYEPDYWNSQKEFMRVRYSHSNGTRFVLQLILWPCGMETPEISTDMRQRTADCFITASQHVMLPKCCSGVVNDGCT